MFSDVDIEREIVARKKDPEKGIAIEPFEKKSLTPVGYDLRVGKRGFSLKNKRELNIEGKTKIEIQPNDTVVIETLESVSLSKKIGATIHSMASLVVLQGLSHISTTIDPGWSGKLLISFHNYRDSFVELEFKEVFCTVCFYRVESEAKVPLVREADRDDLLRQLKQKCKEEEQKEEERNKKASMHWMFVLVILISAFGVLGFLVSLKNPPIGGALSPLIALVISILYDRLKPR
ncbi:MAG: deoxycytidine deaminase [Microcoleus vaginatus WJT46-NPBG5]|jgi:dCTP deaminase|nr:deoxycytidine deaminase [Microcoleus vaginatus WJT46-NPBG5]